MAEASNSVHLTNLRTRLHFAANTLALQAATKAIKARLQAEGLRQSQFLARELRARAEQYLADHREELLKDASATVEQWRQSGFFGKRAALLSDAQGGRA
jgi:hypothetical protein